MMIVHVDPSSPVPPYEQLRAQIAGMVASGVMPEGSRLPTIRQLASDLGIAEGTVARAYRELERDGWMRARRRHGSFVSRPPGVPAAAAEQVVAEAAAAFAVRVRQAGVDTDRAVAAVRRALEPVEELPA